MAKDTYERYMRQLETKVAVGDIELFEFYRRVSNAHLDGKLTKTELRKLLKEGTGYEY